MIFSVSQALARVHISIRVLVTQLIAETTTKISLYFFSFAIISAVFCIISRVQTDVPPNFKIFIFFVKEYFTYL
jgi:hypothetical protein